jgi:hypothetical protein
MKESEKEGLSAWSVSQGSLEDVFINVVKKYRGGQGLLDGLNH